MSGHFLRKLTWFSTSSLATSPRFFRLWWLLRSLTYGFRESQITIYNLEVINSSREQTCSNLFSNPHSTQHNADIAKRTEKQIVIELFIWVYNIWIGIKLVNKRLDFYEDWRVLKLYGHSLYSISYRAQGEHQKLIWDKVHNKLLWTLWEISFADHIKTRSFNILRQLIFL